MHADDQRLLALYNRLLDAYGPQAWWPGGDDPFEVIVGAILTQRTAWRNASLAIEALREADLLAPERIRHVEPEVLETIIRPSGFYRAKAATLKAFCAMVASDDGGALQSLFALPMGKLRDALLRVVGIGEETADAILLYAAGHPQFVVDAYTCRLMDRLGWIDGAASYGRVQDAFTRALPPEVDLYREYHALIVCHGKAHCRSRPRCVNCPIETLCTYRHREAIDS